MKKLDVLKKRINAKLREYKKFDEKMFYRSDLFWVLDLINDVEK